MACETLINDHLLLEGIKEFLGNPMRSIHSEFNELLKKKLAGNNLVLIGQKGNNLLYIMHI